MMDQFERLNQLDAAVQKVFATLAQGYANVKWDSLWYVSRLTPSGVHGIDCWRVLDGVGSKDYPNDRNAERALANAVKDHWKLTQDMGEHRWIMMTVKLDRTGKCSADFDYGEYVEGDINRYNVDLVDGKPTLVKNPYFREEPVD